MESFLSGEWLTIITLAVQAGILKFAYKLYKNFILKENNRDSAIRGLLRVEIINICHRAEKDGVLPIWALENLTDMYNTYKALGGNGAIGGLYNKTIRLPQRKEE
ncbi:hypothetical protein [Megamonas hypermegale]|uniref:hypothetical protein n=1 Tax=Megamonas hypermegale TaxID=158847 RepID=UPI0026F24BD8|nr:hypothetical protein [Megamonas hypermegale]